MVAKIASLCLAIGCCQIASVYLAIRSSLIASNYLDRQIAITFLAIK
jgi:hypothetical protein